jgi:hypothetical protein
MSGSFAYHAPSQPTAYQPPDADPTMERKPDNMDAETHDVVRDYGKLGGLRGPGGPKEQGA